MKKIKILSILFIALSTIFVSCVDSEDSLDVDNGIIAQGVTTTLKGTTGKLLGNALDPTDLENSKVTLSDANADLVIVLDIEPGNFAKNVTKYEIVKSLNGGTETVVAETTTLPYTISYNTVAEYLSGLNLDTDNLRIGDQINFRVKVFTTDGSVYYQGESSSKYDVTINCASALAGVYSLHFTSNYGHDIHFATEIITEVSPGVYKTSRTYRWDLGVLGVPEQGFTFEDVCGTLNAPSQGLAQGAYSNLVYSFKDGSADPATGELQIFYITEFDGGADKIECTGIYTKK